MYGLYNWYDKVKRYYRFNKQEIIGVFFTVLLFAFIFGLDDGRATASIDVYWLKNILNMFLISALAVIVHISAQKIYALKLGFKAEFKAWYAGLIISVVLVLAFKAKIMVLLPGGMIIHHMAKHRLGYWRYGSNMGAFSAISAAGPLTSLGLAIIFKLISFGMPNNSLIHAAMLINVWYAVFSVIPVPPLDGSKMFFGNMLAYYFIAAFVICAAIMLIWLNSLLATLFISLIVGLVMMLVFSIVWNKLVNKSS